METLTLTELAARCALRWRVLVAGALVGLSAGVVAHVAQPDRFRATAVVFVDSSQPDRIDMTAEAAVASSRRVGDEALDALGDPATGPHQDRTTGPSSPDGRSSPS